LPPDFDRGSFDSRRDGRSSHAIISQTRHLGIAQGKTLVLDMDDLYLAFDLAICTAPKDRSRAIDRYARAGRLTPQSDESLVPRSCGAPLIIIFVRRHPVAGLIVKDLFRGMELWLVDEGFESSLPDGAGLATRLFIPEGFAANSRRLRRDGQHPRAAGRRTDRGCDCRHTAIAYKGYEEMIAVSQRRSIVLPLRAG
jgi:hypothetical protein